MTQSPLTPAEYKARRLAAEANYVKLYIVPCTLAEANSFVANLHRQHFPVVSTKFTVACATADGVVHGVAIIGHPVARMLDDGISCEVNRCCTDGTPNACSVLYGAAWRTAKNMGYRRMFTYTLDFTSHGETGGSLRAMGWNLVEGAGGGNWANSKRKANDRHPLDKKLRWEVVAQDEFPLQEVVWPVFTAAEDQLPLFAEENRPTVVSTGRATQRVELHTKAKPQTAVPAPKQAQPETLRVTRRNEFFELMKTQGEKA